MRGYGAGKVSDENSKPAEVWEATRHDLVFEIALEKLLQPARHACQYYRCRKPATHYILDAYYCEEHKGKHATEMTDF